MINVFFCVLIGNVKWDHLGNVDPNSMKTFFSTNTMGSSSPL